MSMILPASLTIPPVESCVDGVLGWLLAIPRGQSGAESKTLAGQAREADI